MRNPRVNYLIKKFGRSIGFLYQKARKNLQNISLFFVLLLLFSFLTYQIADTSQKGEQRRKILIEKKGELDALKKTNGMLKNQAEYYGSNRYILEQSRNVLGLTYPNEKQIQVDGLSNVIDQAKKAEQNITPTPSPIPNIDKWIKLIFD